MDKTFLALNEAYEEFRLEVIASIKALGGTIEDLSPTELYGKIIIDPKLQSYAEECIADALIRYNKKRDRILMSDSFIGVKLMLLEQEGN